MQCKCGEELRWKSFQGRSVNVGIMLCVQLCVQCGVKHIVSNVGDEEGVNILFNCDRNSWQDKEIKELDVYVKHSCTDFCFYKGRNLYTYWPKRTRNIIVCKNFAELLNGFTL